MVNQRNILAFDGENQRQPLQTNEEEQSIEIERTADFGYHYKEEENKDMDTIDAYAKNRERRNRVNIEMDMVNTLESRRTAYIKKIEPLIIKVMDKMAKNAKTEIRFDEMSRGELLSSIMQIGTGDGFKKMFHSMAGSLDAYRETWKAAHSLAALSTDVIAENQTLKEITEPETLNKIYLVRTKAISAEGSHVSIMGIGTEGVIFTIDDTEDSIAQNMVKESVSDESLLLLSHIQSQLTENIKELEKLYNSFEQKATAFLMAGEIAENGEGLKG